MIGDGENSGFMGFGLLGLWVSICFILFYLLLLLLFFAYKATPKNKMGKRENQL